MTPRRGEIWWVNLDPATGSEIAKTRPCVVFSANIVNARRKTVVIIPLSSSPHARPPLIMPVHCAGRKVVVVIDQIRAVAKERLKKLIGPLAPEELEAVEQGLREVLDLG